MKRLNPALLVQGCRESARFMYPDASGIDHWKWLSTKLTATLEQACKQHNEHVDAVETVGPNVFQSLLEEIVADADRKHVHGYPAPAACDWLRKVRLALGRPVPTRRLRRLALEPLELIEQNGRR